MEFGVWGLGASGCAWVVVLHPGPLLKAYVSLIGNRLATSGPPNSMVLTVSRRISFLILSAFTSSLQRLLIVTCRQVAASDTQCSKTFGSLALGRGARKGPE